jgi:pimeloyl-ACP methyl ester carboxylesterase
VLSDHLTRQGIAVLRVDDRGVGGSSGNVIQSGIQDYVTDVQSGLAYLRQHPRIDTRRVGLLGHSEGGIVAPMVAAQSAEVAFVVLLGAPGVDGVEVLIQQDSAFSEPGTTAEEFAASRQLNRRLFELLRETTDTTGVRERVAASLRAEMASFTPRQRQLLERELGARPDSAIAAQMRVVLTPWFRSLVAADPQLALRRVRVPVLSLAGSLDLQVPAGPNQAAIERALREAGNRDVTVVTLPGLNHLLQHARTGQIEEYAAIEETMAPEVLTRIGEWILARVRR